MFSNSQLTGLINVSVCTFGYCLKPVGAEREGERDTRCANKPRPNGWLYHFSTFTKSQDHSEVCNSNNKLASIQTQHQN